MARYFVLACVMLAWCCANTALAVTCGDTLTNVPLSGCLECTEVNMTRHGHGYRRHLLHGDGPGGELGGTEGFPEGSDLGTATLLVPSCTKCDTNNNFVLMTRDGDSSIGRCGCNDTYGVVITGNATVVVGNDSRTVPQFECALCGNNEVPLGPKSGLKFSMNTDGTWQLVLSSGGTAYSSTTVTGTTNGTTHKKRKNRRKRTRSVGTSTASAASNSAVTTELSNLAATMSFRGAAATADQPEVVPPPTAGPEAGAITTASHHGGPGGFGANPDGDFGGRQGGGDFGGRHGDGFGRELPAGYTPGQCVPCPAGSTTTDNITCVKSG